MTSSIWIAAIIAAVGGGVIGVWLGRRGGREAVEARSRAEKELAAQSARTADAARAQQAKAAKDLQEARAAWTAEAAQAAAAQRAEIEKLTRHLTEAYDELDRLRADAARTPKPPDTGQGFAATMPLGDL